ncbi:MAG: hypothetical protein ABR592_09130 [Nitriliruptorales bacterium]
MDFWRSATFSWDGKVVGFSDESLGVELGRLNPQTQERALRN